MRHYPILKKTPRDHGYDRENLLFYHQNAGFSCIRLNKKNTWVKFLTIYGETDWLCIITTSD